MNKCHILFKSIKPIWMKLKSNNSLVCKLEVVNFLLKLFSHFLECTKKLKFFLGNFKRENFGR